MLFFKKSKLLFTTQTLRITEGTICAGFVMSCLLYTNLNYSENTLLSHHPSQYVFLTCCCTHVSSCKNNFFFNFEREELCLQALNKRMHKRPFWRALPEWCNYMEKNHPGETDSSFAKAGSRLWKICHLVRNGKFFTWN